MTYSEVANTTVVGPCPISCRDTKMILTSDVSNLNRDTCGYWNREGQHCGRCTPNHAPQVYSYTLNCVRCEESDLALNIVKYIAAAYLPLTVFFVLVVMFKVSATSDSLSVVVLVNQMFTASSIITLYTISNTYYKNPTVKILLSVVGIWNLDFFRPVYTSLCIHPKIDILHVLAL